MQSEFNIIAEVFFFVCTFCIICTTLIIIFTLYQRKFKFSKQMELLEEDHQKSLLTAQLEMQEQTFQHISQEIHDHIGQRLTLARLYLNSRKQHDAATEEELIDQSAGLIETAINDLKQLSRSLTADLIKDYGLIKAVQFETERLNKPGLHTHLTVSGNTVFLDTEKELILFRIIQEALQNMMKHAKATSATINLNYENENLFITVADNGTGFDDTAVTLTGKSGIKNMQRRAELLLGKCTISTRIHGGTSVNLQIPISNHLTTN
jgi:two-component system, NarL family, sensor kinase